MKTSNLLFVCSRNQWRSPTGEIVFRQKGYITRSAGTSPNAKHTINSSDIEWADIIFLMEQKHKDILVANFQRLLQYKNICVLDIPDEYKAMDVELIRELEGIVEAYLEE